MHDRLPAKERLESYRTLITSAITLSDVMADTEDMHLEVSRPGEPEIICSLPVSCPADNRELIRRHIEIPADLIGMLDAAARRDAERRRVTKQLRRTLEAKSGTPAKDYSAECAMKCSEPALKRFLIERHNLLNTITDTTAATRVRSIPAIPSHNEVNTDSAAAARWRETVREFEAWRRKG